MMRPRDADDGKKAKENKCMKNDDDDNTVICYQCKTSSVVDVAAIEKHAREFVLKLPAFSAAAAAAKTTTTIELNFKLVIVSSSSHPVKTSKKKSGVSYVNGCFPICYVSDDAVVSLPKL